MLVLDAHYYYCLNLHDSTLYFTCFYNMMHLKLCSSDTYIMSDPSLLQCTCTCSYGCICRSVFIITHTCNYFVGSCSRPTHPSHPMTSFTTSASRYGPLKFRLLSNFHQIYIHVHVHVCTHTSHDTVMNT